MEYNATAKYIRTSTRKIRLVADAIRSMTADKAVAYLKLTPKHAGDPMMTVLQSAIANAKQKGVESKDLKIQKIEVMQGPSMKRFHAVSRGMAHSYKKRMSHITVVLSTIEKQTDKKGDK